MRASIAVSVCVLGLFTPAAVAADPPPVATHPAYTPGVTASAPCPADSLCQMTAPPAEAKQLGAQVFFRFGGGFIMGEARGNGDYTDARAARGLANDGKSGFAMGFGLHLPLMKDPIFENTVCGEVLIDYAQFSQKNVVPVTSALFQAPFVNDVRVNQLAVVGSPKYRIDSLGSLRPWVIPVGMAFLVNSPPSDNSSYIDVGLHFGVGVDYRITKSVSLGVDCRYNLNLTREGVSWLTTAAYLGFDF
jgi:opacity protein-like surface antigen